MARTRWLWLPGEDGGVALADPRDFPADLPPGVPPGPPLAGRAGLPSGVPPDLDGAAPALRAVSG